MRSIADVDGQRPEALQVLLDASSLLLGDLSPEAVLTAILDRASKLLAADAYAVWRDCEGEGSWRAVSTQGLSPSYRTQFKIVPAAAPLAMQAIENIEAESMLQPFREVYAAEGIRSLLIAPLEVPERQAGTITFYWRRVHRPSAREMDYAAALANLSAAALNTSELHAQNQREKRRLSFLAEASTILASSLDYETTLNRVAQLAVPQIADWCTVHIVENGSANRLVVAHADPAMLSMAQEYSVRYPEEIRDDVGLGAVLRTGKSEIITHITDEMVVAAARDPDHLKLLRKLRLSASILVPLSSRGKVLGAIRLLAAGDDRHFTADDVQLAQDLARRAASAIENAQLHRAVLKQESQLRLSHAAAHMGSWSWDLVKGEISWSDEFKQLHGLPLDAQPSFDNGSTLVHPDDRGRVLQDLSQVLASGADQLTSESRAITPDGRTLCILSHGTIQRDATGEPLSIVGISMDVTEQRQAEAALRRTEKLAAAGRLAATVAHEVNNPLEALTNLIYLAGSAEGLPAEARGYLATAESELSRMAHIVRQTLGFYRDSASPRETDLGQVVREVMDLYRSRAESRAVTLSCNLMPAVMICANPGEIKQVVANLISNALDASVDASSVEISVHRSGQHAEIVVADTGTGIREEHLARLFEPFFTTKADVGTGLGLWVSKGIVEKHNGSISVASRSDPSASGTTFTITLPSLQGTSA